MIFIELVYTSPTLESYRVPMIIGLCVGGVLLLLIVAILIAAVIFIKRRKGNANDKRAASSTYSCVSSPIEH